MRSWLRTPCASVTATVEPGTDERCWVAVSYRYDVRGRSLRGERYGLERRWPTESAVQAENLRSALMADPPKFCWRSPDRPTESVLFRPTPGEAFARVARAAVFPLVGAAFALFPWWGVLRRKRKGKADASSSSRGPVWIGAVFVLVGVGLIYPVAIRPLSMALAVRYWEPVEAVVTESRVKAHRSDDGTTYSPYVAYRYEVGGREYLGDRYAVIQMSSSGYAGKEAIVRAYPVGRKFEVFADPEDPTRSVVVRDVGPEMLLGLFPLVFIVAGVFIMRAGFGGGGKLDPRQASRRIVRLKGTSPLGKAAGVTLFFAVWTAISVFLWTTDAAPVLPAVFSLFAVLLLAGSIREWLACFNPRPVVEMTPGNLYPGAGVSLRWEMKGKASRIGELVVTLRCVKVVSESVRTSRGRSTRVRKKPIFEEELLRSEHPAEIAKGTLSFTLPADRPASRPGFDRGIEWSLEFRGAIDRWPDLKQTFPIVVYPAPGE